MDADGELVEHPASFPSILEHRYDGSSDALHRLRGNFIRATAADSCQPHRAELKLGVSVVSRGLYSSSGRKD